MLGERAEELELGRCQRDAATVLVYVAPLEIQGYVTGPNDARLQLLG